MSLCNLSALKVLLILPALMFSSCVNHSLIYPTEKTRNPASAIAFFLEQETAAKSFVTSGSISYSKKMRFDEGNFFAVGDLNPLKLKLEITHPLGGDIMHALLDKNHIEAVFFREKNVYKGEYYESVNINDSLFANPSIAWHIFRGFPLILPYKDFYVEDNNRFSLLENNSILIQSVTLEKDRMIPVSVGYNNIGIIVDIDSFSNNDNIFYASAIKITSKNTDEVIEIKFKSHEFNLPIAQEIFNIIFPPGFPILPFYMDSR